MDQIKLTEPQLRVLLQIDEKPGFYGTFVTRDCLRQKGLIVMRSAQRDVLTDLGRRYVAAHRTKEASCPSTRSRTRP